VNAGLFLETGEKRTEIEPIEQNGRVLVDRLRPRPPLDEHTLAAAKSAIAPNCAKSRPMPPQ
jgi:hypothetical protein